MGITKVGKVLRRTGLVSEALTEAGVTIHEAAKATKVPAHRLWRWDREGIPQSVLDAVRLSKSLGITVEDLVKSKPA